MRWSLATQLRWGFAVALLLVIGVSVVAWRVALDYRHAIEHAYGTHLRGTVQLAEAESALWQLRYDIPQFMVGSPEDRKRILEDEDRWHAMIEDRLAAYARTAYDVEERRAITNLRSVYQRYRQARQKLFELWAAGEKDDARAWHAMTTTPFGAETVRAFGALIALQRSLAGREQAETERKVREALGLVAAIAVALLAMLAIGYYASTVRMLRPIRALRARAEGMVREQFGDTLAASSSSNEVAALVESFQLMSDRLLARTESLRQSRERLDYLLRATPAVIWSCEASGDFRRTFLSANVHSMIGYDAEEITADPGFWRRNIHPDDCDRVFAGLAAIATEDAHAHEYRFRHKDGSWRWLRAELVVMRDGAGAPHELVGYWIDVTARKEAEDALRESADRYERAVNGANDGIWEWIPSTGEDYLSPRWKRLLGYEDHELPNVQESFFDQVHPEDRPRISEAVRTHLEDRKPFEVELRLRCKSGEYRWFSSRGQAEWDPQGRPLRMAGSITDITEHKRVVTELQRLGERLTIANRALEQATRMKSEFMASVTHELRTPLNSVIGFAELLKDEVPGPLNAKQTTFVGDIFAAGEHLLRLVEGILEISRLDTAGVALQREPVAIGAALEERVAAQRKAAEARDIAIELEVAPKTGAMDLDPKALRRILDALIDNAIKFNHDGGTVTVRARRAGDALEIAVADTGIGIARDDLAKLFKPFAQLDAGLARRHGGIGMGLALARRLAELHGGTIEVESEPGEGSTFTLRLPAGVKT